MFKELKTLTAPFILRREKKEVLMELPEKTEVVRYCEFKEGQKNLYDEIRLLDQLRMEEMDGDVSKQTIHLLTMILRLRQIACHPFLFPEPKGIVPESGKLDAVMKTADEILSENHKILVFSQFVKHLELVKAECDRLKIENFMLHGSTKDRQQIITQFKESRNPGIFFISLKAGGFGINLTEASYVFLLDPWWNPAVENQAIDRCYRMGQRENVTVIRFITKDSIEERVKKLQLKKKEMIDDIITETDLNQSPLTRDELVALIRH